MPLESLGDSITTAVIEALWIVLGREPNEFEDQIEEFWHLSRYPHEDDPPEVVDELLTLYGDLPASDDDVY